MPSVAYLWSLVWYCSRFSLLTWASAIQKFELMVLPTSQGHEGWRFRTTYWNHKYGLEVSSLHIWQFSYNKPIWMCYVWDPQIWVHWVTWGSTAFSCGRVSVELCQVYIWKWCFLSQLWNLWNKSSCHWLGKGFYNNIPVIWPCMKILILVLSKSVKLAILPFLNV